MSRWFISHSTQDRPFVESELIGLFQALGQEVWYCREDIVSGEEWERSIKSGLQLSDWFVLVMSPLGPIRLGEKGTRLGFNLSVGVDHPSAHRALRPIRIS